MSTQRNANGSEPEAHDDELGSELESVTGGALNAYLNVKGQKSGDLKLEAKDGKKHLE